MRADPTIHIKLEGSLPKHEGSVPNNEGRVPRSPELARAPSPAGSDPFWRLQQRLLPGLAILALVVAALVLWARHGVTIFTEALASAIALCF